MEHTKVYKCPFGNRKYHNKPALYEHMESAHKVDLQKMPASRVYFNIRNRKNHGNCVICKSETAWNMKTEKYERLCKKESCRKKYRQIFVDRMKKVHGKTMLLDDPEFQKKMLKGRKISGTYKWENGYEHDYTGSYEHDFLKFMERVLNWENPNDIMMPAPQSFTYKMNGKKHFYIPDVYITSIDLYIEIKGSNNHYQKRDHVMEVLKDKMMLKNKKINYIKILDKSYAGFVEYLHKRINGTSKYILKEDLYNHNMSLSVLNENRESKTPPAKSDESSTTPEDDKAELISLVAKLTENGKFKIYELTKDKFTPTKIENNDVYTSHFNTAKTDVPEQYWNGILEANINFYKDKEKREGVPVEIPTLDSTAKMLRTRKNDRSYDLMTLIFLKQTNKVIGYSFISKFKRTDSSDVVGLDGGMTVILDEYQGHGYGRILKQESLKQIFKDYPDHIITTRLHKNNNKIIKLNTSIGYEYNVTLSEPQALIDAYDNIGKQNDMSMPDALEKYGHIEISVYPHMDRLYTELALHMFRVIEVLDNIDTMTVPEVRSKLENMPYGELTFPLKLQLTKMTIKDTKYLDREYMTTVVLPLEDKVFELQNTLNDKWEKISKKNEKVYQYLLHSKYTLYNEMKLGMEDYIDQHAILPVMSIANAEYTNNKLKTMTESEWSDKVKIKHTKTPEGIFTKSAKEIETYLINSSKDKQQAMQRLNFYINRAGKNLSDARKTELNKVKKMLETEPVNEFLATAAATAIAGTALFGTMAGIEWGTKKYREWQKSRVSKKAHTLHTLADADAISNVYGSKYNESMITDNILNMRIKIYPIEKHIKLLEEFISHSKLIIEIFKGREKSESEMRKMFKIADKKYKEFSVYNKSRSLKSMTVKESKYLDVDFLKKKYIPTYDEAIRYSGIVDDVYWGSNKNNVYDKYELFLAGTSFGSDHFTYEYLHQFMYWEISKISTNVVLDILDKSIIKESLEYFSEDYLNTNNTRILLATHNTFKISEYKKYSTGNVEMLEGIPDIDEVDSKNLYDIVIHKIKDMYDIVKPKLPTDAILAIEDTSLNVDGEEVGGNIRWLIDKLDTYIGKRATVSMIIAMTDGEFLKIFRSDTDGVIVKSSGDGYGFDPYFEVKGVGLTLAQIKKDTNEQLQATTNGRKLVMDKIKNNDFVFEKRLSEIQKWTGKIQSH